MRARTARGTAVRAVCSCPCYACAQCCTVILHLHCHETAAAAAGSASAKAIAWCLQQEAHDPLVGCATYGGSMALPLGMCGREAHQSPRECLLSVKSPRHPAGSAARSWRGARCSRHRHRQQSRLRCFHQKKRATACETMSVHWHHPIHPAECSDVYSESGEGSDRSPPPPMPPVTATCRVRLY